LLSLFVRIEYTISRFTASARPSGSYSDLDAEPFPPELLFSSNVV